MVKVYEEVQYEESQQTVPSSRFTFFIPMEFQKAKSLPRHKTMDGAAKIHGERMACTLWMAFPLNLLILWTRVMLETLSLPFLPPPE
jgi:hypothetical protein